MPSFDGLQPDPRIWTQSLTKQSDVPIGLERDERLPGDSSLRGASRAIQRALLILIGVALLVGLALLVNTVFTFF